MRIFAMPVQCSRYTNDRNNFVVLYKYIGSNNKLYLQRMN